MCVSDTVTMRLTGPKKQINYKKVKSINIILLIGSRLHLGNVFLGGVHCLAINLQYENLQVMEYVYTTLQFNKRSICLVFSGFKIKKKKKNTDSSKSDEWQSNC